MTKLEAYRKDPSDAPSLVFNAGNTKVTMKPTGFEVAIKPPDEQTEGGDAVTATPVIAAISDEQGLSLCCRKILLDKGGGWVYYVASLWWNSIHASLKHWCLQERVGATPISDTGELVEWPMTRPC